jgi:ABC-type antimicrobial peptide transport system permease subunit
MAIGLRSGLRQALEGLAIGILAALLLVRMLRTLLQGVSPTDPATFAAVIVVTGLVALAASLGPAYRAGRIDPNMALRAD